MPSSLLHLVTLFIGFYLTLLPLVDAALFVVTPAAGSTCHGGHPCTVTWLDDGISPLLSAIGVCSVGVYTGNQQLIQTLKPVDVSLNLSFAFTPDPAAGPDSRAYYIAFTSIQSKVNGTQPYIAYSPYFQLEGMTGSFDNPIPSATRSIPIPSSLTLRPSSTALSTITVGTLLTATPIPTLSTSFSRSSASSSSSFSSSVMSPSTTASPSSSRFISSIKSSSTTALPSSTNTPPLGNSNSGANGMSKPLSYASFCIAIVISNTLS